MKSRLLLILLFIQVIAGLNTTTQGQNPLQDLQKGIQEYKNIITFLEPFDRKFTSEVIDELGIRTEKCMALLKQARENVNEEQKLVSDHFMQALLYEYGKTLANSVYYQSAFDILDPLEESYLVRTSAGFPIDYVMPDGQYRINWTDFEPVRAEYITIMAEVCFILDKIEESERYSRLLTSGTYRDHGLDVNAWGILLDIKELKPDLITDEQYCSDVLDYLKSYDALDDDGKIVQDWSLDGYSIGECVLILVGEGSKPGSTPKSIASCAEAVTIASKYAPEDSGVLQLYDICYDKYSSNAEPGLIYAFTPVLPAYEFSRNAEKYARNMRDADQVLAGKVGLSATARMAETAYDNSYKSNDCAKLAEVADNYQYWNQPAEEAKYRKLAESCQSDRLKTERREARNQRQDNSSFNFYTGIYVPQLIASNERRDYGGVLNLSGQKFGMEFSYLQVNQKKENIFDLWIREVDGSRQDNLSRWDGFYAHVQPKFIGKEGKGSYGYIGILLGYAEKRFDLMNVPVVSDADGIQSAADFLPEVNQYIVMLTYGAMVLKKGFGADVFWSVGANYSNFNPGTSIDRNLYTISNPLLEGRKDSYFGFIMRLGLTIGINFGSGR